MKKTLGKKSLVYPVRSRARAQARPAGAYGRATSNGVYAFDFDGVIAEYHGFNGRYNAGEPIKEIVKAIKILKKKGHKITIFSTRGTALLKRYCKKYNIPIDYFNENPEVKTGNQGKPVAHVYIDDRAICYKGQSAERLVKQIKNFKTYWKAN